MESQTPKLVVSWVEDLTKNANVSAPSGDRPQETSAGSGGVVTSSITSPSGPRSVSVSPSLSILKSAWACCWATRGSTVQPVVSLHSVESQKTTNQPPGMILSPSRNL